MFALEYSKDFDAIRAYKECGAYRPKTDAVAASAAARVLTNADFALILNEVLAERISRLELDADTVVLEQLRLGMSDITQFMDWEPFDIPGTNIHVKGSGELTPNQRAAIAELNYNVSQNGFNFKFKLHNKQGALESLFKHLGLYSADKSYTIHLDTEEEKARERVDTALQKVRERLAHVNVNGHRD